MSRGSGPTSRCADEDRPTPAAAAAGDGDDVGCGCDRLMTAGPRPGDGRGSTWPPEVDAAAATESAPAH